MYYSWENVYINDINYAYPGNNRRHRAFCAAGVGRPDDEVRKALLAVDVTDEVMAEAEREGCDLIITHHPIVFHALKRFNSADQVQRCVERAIRSGIALYACHTNLDSAPEGMSWRLA